MTFALPKTFTPAQVHAVHMLKLGYQIRHPMTGNCVAFLHHPCKKGGKISIGTFTALLNANLLTLLTREYPFETYALKAEVADC